MKIISLFALFFAWGLAETAKMHDGVLVLTDENFMSEMEKYDKGLLVEFFSPGW